MQILRFAQDDKLCGGWLERAGRQIGLEVKDGREIA